MKKPKRKLAAIVFTDIVGFTKLSSNDQEKASGILKKQRETFQPIVAKYNGLWVKEIGDGLLLTFDTIIEAVNCCIIIQKKSRDIDSLDLRIGIHQGEILIQGNDVIGDDVNIASRIEPLSAIGGIAISNKVNDALVRESKFKTKYLGKPKLKGVSQNVEVFCIISHNLEETKLSGISAKLEPVNHFKWNIFSITGAILSVIGILFWINISFLGIGIASENRVPSISILVPDNLGDEVNNKWMNFLTENIIIDIANNGNLIVTPLRNVMKVARENLNTNDISKRLKSDYLLLSSVYVDGENFDMNSQLINAKNKKSIFGKKINDNINNIPIVSDQIALDIIKNIGSKPNIEIAAKGRQKRFNDAYNIQDYKKAYDIVKPAQRDGGLVVNIKGDYSFNRSLGTLTDNFFQLFNNKILPKIKSSIYDVAIDIHCSRETLPQNSIFKNNLDMTVAVAGNLDAYIKNLNLERNVYIYGLGDMVPYSIDSLKRTKSNWNPREDTTEGIIRELNRTLKQRINNNRISITFLKPE
tara:strand:+ start:687 stop:2270 length:1584 start_codon:yes stop_codon:yes gene_type:complete